MAEATCRACGARMVWTRTAAGKAMPLDAEPHPDGNVRLLPDGSCEVLSAPDLEAQRARESLGGPFLALYRSHFASCPQASRFRRAK
jgi:hypothetical protein